MLAFEIIANENGLRWRHGLYWKQCTWDDVTDYYEEFWSKTMRRTVIVTTAGKLTLSHDFYDPKPLREIVQQNAANAAVKKWMVFGTRPVDLWPREFDYRTKDNRSQPFAIWFSAILLPVAWAVVVAPKIPILLSGSAGGWDWFGFGIITILMLAMGALIAAVSWPMASDLGQRRSQKITADLTGVTYEDAGDKIEASWHDVTDYYISPYRIGIMDTRKYVVATSVGEFDFTFRIKGCRLLKEIIERYSLNVVQPGWRVEGPDWNEIPSKANSWAATRSETGDGFFSYRTRINRSLLWYPTVIALVVPIQMALTYIFGITPRPSIWTDVNICGAMLLISIWGWWRYFSGGIRVTDSDITQYTPLGARTIRWEDVTDYYTNGADIFISGNVVADRRRIRFWAGIARWKELKAVIAKRATRCAGKPWGED